MDATPTLKRIAVTPGEPGGIGPDLCIMLAQQSHACQLVAIADPDLLMQRAESLGLKLEIKSFDPLSELVEQSAGSISVLPVKMNVPAQSG